MHSVVHVKVGQMFDEEVSVQKRSSFCLLFMGSGLQACLSTGSLSVQLADVWQIFLWFISVPKRILRSKMPNQKGPYHSKQKELAPDISLRNVT